MCEKLVVYVSSEKMKSTTIHEDNSVYIAQLKERYI